MNRLVHGGVGYIHEIQAIPFGVVGIAVLLLALSRSARGYARSARRGLDRGTLCYEMPGDLEWA